MIIGLMGAELFVLTGSSNKITFQTNRAFLEAVEQNMISSSLAWAKYNIERGNIKKTEGEIQLDTAGIGARDTQLTITIEKIIHKQAQVTINTSCSFGGQCLKHNKKYVVSRKQ
jgi:hypothetical protein